MTSNSEWLLSKLLECGTADLEILNGIELDCDIFELYESLEKELGRKPTLEDIFVKAAFIAFSNMQDEIKNTIEEYEDSTDADDIAMVEILKSLDPSSDFEINFNYSATYIICNQNQETYGWHPEWINEFRKKINFEITNIPSTASLIKKNRKISTIKIAVEKVLERNNADDVKISLNNNEINVICGDLTVFACCLSDGLHEEDIMEIADEYDIGYSW